MRRLIAVIACLSLLALFVQPVHAGKNAPLSLLTPVPDRLPAQDTGAPKGLLDDSNATPVSSNMTYSGDTNTDVNNSRPTAAATSTSPDRNSSSS